MNRFARALSPLSRVLLWLQVALVVTGGAVRLTGSGLGCPTWPECTPGSYKPVANQVEGQLRAWIEFGNRLITFLLLAAAVATLIAVLKSRRRDLRLLAIGQVLGIFGQGILGGITVLVKLHPAAVASHFLLSIFLISGAYSLFDRRNLSATIISARTPKIGKVSRVHLTLTFLVLVLGTIVTGSGPHAGDLDAPRYGFGIQRPVYAHTAAVVALLVISLYFLRLSDVSRESKRGLKFFIGLCLAQGGIGYIQYLQGVPELLVASHIFGSTLIWISAWRIRLSVISHKK